MKLRYRGVVHSYSSSLIPSIETSETALFLGSTYRVRQPIYQPKQNTLNLVYRGVAYSTGNDAASQPALRQSQPSEFVMKLSAQLGLSGQS